MSRRPQERDAIRRASLDQARSGVVVELPSARRSKDIVPHTTVGVHDVHIEVGTVSQGGSHVQLHHDTATFSDPNAPSIERFRTSLDVPRITAELKQQAAKSGDNSKAGKDKEQTVEKLKYSDEHKIPLTELLQRLGSHVDLDNVGASRGLTKEEAADRLRINGPNVLTPPKQLPAWLQYLAHYLNPFMILLEAAGVLCFITYAIDSVTRDVTNLYLGIVLILIVIITCTVSFVQERQSSNVIAGFKNLLPDQCRVVRDGEPMKIQAADLVVGDIVDIAMGNKIPADVRMLSVSNLKVDNSSITGESEPQECSVECTHDSQLETHNLAFYGSLVFSGDARGIVIRTGNSTLIGSIAKLATTTKKMETTLQKEIRIFVRFITILALTMGAAIFIIGMATRPQDWITNIIATIGIIVANVPEGLPATVTACLTITARRLAKKNVFVKKLDCIETLGSCTMIASDKTGTLTQNRMTVSHLWYDMEIWGIDIATRGCFNPKLPSCHNLLRIASCCNRAIFDPTVEGNLELPISKRIILGDASESALVRVCEPIKPTNQSRMEFPKIFEIPFNSTNKWQLSIHGQPEAIPEDAQAILTSIGVDPATVNAAQMIGTPAELLVPDQRRLLMMKGAPEIIVGRCTSCVQDGKILPITEEWQAKFQEAYDALGGMGERVLGFAFMYLDPTQFGPEFDDKYDSKILNFPTTGLVFGGLMSLIDPPRDGVADAIHDCHTAGIRVIMVTGDHPITAKAIAKKIGIISLETADEMAKRLNITKDAAIRDATCQAVVLRGDEIEKFDQPLWDAVLTKKEIVFARTSPQQKLQIVENSQRLGNIVAVTGDGVNDSPALKKADIGVAMGIVGSDVAKEAASIILMDDNFCSIVEGIKEGRVIFDNLKKSIAYTLSHLLPEVIPFLIAIIIGLPAAISSVLILIIDLGTEMVPAVSLAYEKAESDIMKRRPRKQTDHLVSWQVIVYAYFRQGVTEWVACYFLYFFVMAWYGFWPWHLFAFGTVANAKNNYYNRNADPLTIDGVVYSGQYQWDAVCVAQTSYFMCLVVCQMANLLVCKTRTRSLFRHGMMNKVVNIGLFIEIAIVILLSYIPGLDIAINTRPIMIGYFWLVPLPFAIWIFSIEEVRKALNRNFKKSIFTKITKW